MPNVTTARKGVFISYARTDGEKFADLLRRRLETENIPLWQDRVGMEGGRDWWLQITGALDRVEFMALVITPNALKSDTVRKEWRYARQQGVCVYPIKGTPDLDFDSLPRWMRSAHFYDMDHEWQKFVNDLKTRCQTKRVPFMVEDLPEGFVPRPGEFDQLLKLLIDERREEPVAITAALRGAGGYGKTTLAKALCHDERIQQAFDDGILWVTLGENPGDLTGRVEDLIVTLGDDRPGFTTQDAAVNRLKELLADLDILIVIDDVWDRAHLNPFIQGGPRCARLITTRNLETLPATTQKIPVDAMQREEAIALLAAGLDQNGLNRELTALASRLGEWPLLLRLVNSALRNRIENDKQSAHDAIRWINTALTKRGLAIFDARNSDERNQAVARTIGVSLDLLSVQEHERYGELAIFPEDIEIPLATVEKLWGKTGGLDEFDTEYLCNRLNSFSLLWSYDANHRSIRLHDVVRKFLIERQGDKLSWIHQQLLDAHRPAVSLRWAEMRREEPYLWNHLTHHFLGANRGDELVATVKDWKYLVKKTLLRKSLAVEIDLLAAEISAGNDLRLRLLRRTFMSSGHLLNRCENTEEMKVTLFSLLQHLDDLKFITTDLEQHLKRPCLVPASKFPDLAHPALVRTLSGHSRGVNGTALTPDATTIVSASADYSLKVWDGQSGAERFALIDHKFWVNDCAVDAEGATIVSACDDSTLKVWCGRSGIERYTLRGHEGFVNGCAVSADGAMIVSASDDKTLKVWDGRSGAEWFTLRGHTGSVRGCAISADGRILISASDDQTLKVWDGRNGDDRFTLRGHRGSVRGCAVSAGGLIIVSASDDKTLKVWDAETGTECLTLHGHGSGVNGCAVSADGMTIVSASDDGTLKVWDGESGAERFTWSGHGSSVNDCAVSADGLTIVSASDDETLKVWDGRGGADGFIRTGHRKLVTGCAVSADGATVISASTDKTLKVWDGLSGAERFTLRGHEGDVNDCAVSADGTMIVSASDDQTLKVWDGRSGDERFTMRGHEGAVNNCAVSPDGTMIVSASVDQCVKVWDARSGIEHFTLRGGSISCAISAGGATIIAISENTVKVWDGRSGTERFTLGGHADWVHDCTVSWDGLIIVSASADKTLKVWDGRSGVERFTLRGHDDWVTGCSVSADGAIVISASSDKTVKVWNAQTGECLSTLHVDGALTKCANSENGEIIVAVGTRGVYFLRLLR